MKRKALQGIFVFCVSFLFFTPAAFSQEEENFDALFDGIGEEAKPQTGDSGPSQFRDFGISGNHEVIMPLPVYRDGLVFSPPFVIPRSKNKVKAYYHGSDLTFESGLILDISAFDAVNPLPDIEIRAGENFIAWNTDVFKIAGGFQLHNWGSADRVNPTDNLNPLDYSRAINGEKIPVFSLQGDLYLGEHFSVEGVYIPVAREDVFPTPVSALIPSSLFSESELTVDGIPLKPESLIYATRLKFYSSVADISASYAYDFDSFYTPEINFVSYLEKSLTLTLKRMHRIGLDTKVTAGPFGIWAEACMSLPQDYVWKSPETRAWNLAWTAGLDANWGPEKAFYANLQYTGKYVPDFYKDFYTDYADGQPDPIQYATDPGYAEEYLYRALTNRLGNLTEGLLNGFILNLDFPLVNGKIVPSLMGAYFVPAFYDQEEKIRIGSLVLNPGIAFKPVDTLVFELSGNFYMAWKKVDGEIEFDDEDSIGMYRPQNNVSLSVKYSWAGTFAN